MKWIFTHCKSMEAYEESCNEAMNRIDEISKLIVIVLAWLYS